MLHSAQRKVDILVLPEYAVPPAVLPAMRHWSLKHKMTIVAGSHSVSSKSTEIYAAVGLTVNTGATDDSDVRKALCPVFFPDGSNLAYFKKRRSKWEGELVEAVGSWDWQMVGQDVSAWAIGILLCIDALTVGPIPSLPRPGLLVVPSRTPTVDDFQAFSGLQLLKEIPVAYVNDAVTGLSKIYGVVGKNTKHPLLLADGTKPIPAGSEAVVIADIDLDKQFVKARSTEDHRPLRLISFAPVLYAANRATQEVIDALSRARDGDPYRLTVLGALAGIPRVLTENVKAFAQLERSGGVRKEDRELYLDAVVVPSPALPLVSLQYKALSQVNDTIVALLTQAGLRERAGLITLLNKIQSAMEDRHHIVDDVVVEQTAVSEPLFVDAGKVPFTDRDGEMDSIRDFSNATSKRVLAIFGLRGIGKTRLISEALNQVFPNRKHIVIPLTEGTGFPRFIHALATQLNVPLSAAEEENLDEREVYLGLIQRVLAAFDRLSAACIVIDDCHYFLRKQGFRDERFGVFLDHVMSRATHKNNKMILASKQSFSPPSFTDAFQALKLEGLNDRAIEGILDWHIKSQRGDATPVKVPAALVDMLHGNPLAALVAAGLLEQFPPEVIVKHAGVQQQFQERLIPQLLEQMSLSTEELELIEFTAVFNVAIPFEVFELFTRKLGLVSLISSLVDKFLLEYDSRAKLYRVHPLIRDYFRNGIDSDIRKKYHHIAAKYYEDQSKGRGASPVAMGELVSHLASAGQLERAQKLKRVYYDELRPVALRLFKDKDYDRALDYYEALLQVKEGDWDIHFHISLCYARLGIWNKAEVHFDQAVDFNKQGWWIYTGLADAMIAKRYNINGAEKYILQALEIADDIQEDTWRYSAIYESLAKVYALQRNRPLAERYFRKAVEVYPDSAFANYALAKHLYKSGGDLTEALSLVQHALEVDKTFRDSANLRDRIIGALKDSRGLDDDTEDADENDSLNYDDPE